MNGVVSTLQRRQGLDYKINFGVEIPRIKGIASDYDQNKELAQALWKENIRECRMLAIFLMPSREFTPEDADEWIKNVTFTELADHLAMQLLCNITDAVTHAIEWCKEDDQLKSYCGYMTLSHLLRKGTILSREQEESFLQAADNTLKEGCTANSVTRRCAGNTILKYIDTDREKNIENTRHFNNLNTFLDKIQ